MKQSHLKVGFILCCSIFMGATSFAKSHGSSHGLEICTSADGKSGIMEAKALYLQGNKAYVAKRYKQAYENFSKASSLGYKPADRMLKKLERIAKSKYEKAYVIKKTAPEKAIRNLEIVMQIISPDNVYYGKAKRLKKRIKSGSVKSATNDQGEYKLIKSLPKKSHKLTAKEKSQVKKLKKAADEKLKVEEFQNAIDIYLQALKIDPGNCEIILRIGISRVSSGNNSAAYLWYKKYLEMCPNSPKARQLRQVVEDYESNY